LIHDRDPLYTQEFLTMLKDVGIESVKLPPRSPNLNSYAERFVRSIKEDCLKQMILFGQDSLRNSVGHFLEHYHLERNHQGLENRLIVSSKTPAESIGGSTVPFMSGVPAHLTVNGNVCADKLSCTSDAA